MRYSCLLIFLSFITLVCNYPKLSAQTSPFKAKFSPEELKEAPVKLIPYPQKVQWGKKSVVIKGIKLPSATSASQMIQGVLTGIDLTSNGVPVIFQQDAEIPEQGYSLKVKKNGITITASSESGQFYALQTLKQLIHSTEDSIEMQLCSIYDVPAYDIRGLMIDVGRNYQSLEFLKQQLDIMARYKLNVFQWHLTDRPAWRIESKAYPQLTAPENHRPTRDPGMYYTYDEIRSLFNYAKERHIQIIPEIDMPGHSDSFITSMGYKME